MDKIQYAAYSGLRTAFYPGGPVCSKKSGTLISVSYGSDAELYRSVLLAAQLILEGEDREIAETAQFQRAGVMLDLSRAGVMQVERVKEYMEYMALFGLNALMLYMEDVFTVQGYDYFGYMRGRYSEEELKEIDACGKKWGIEVIPCIQTLGHFEQYIKWAEGARLCDTNTVLMVGKEEVYAFLDAIIGTVSRCFTSRRIHIGMDEAVGMGSGRYLKENGYKKPVDLFCEHLANVKKITDKYGLEPMIWSDMYFRLGSETNAYYDKDAVIEPYVKDLIPENVSLVYWDYYHANEETYRFMIEKHRQMTDRLIFAGGIWLWRGLLPDYQITFDTTNAALKVCKEAGICEVYATQWGDDGCETDPLFGLVGA